MIDGGDGISYLCHYLFHYLAAILRFLGPHQSFHTNQASSHLTMASDETLRAGDDPDYIASRILASLSSSSPSSLRRNPMTSTSLPRPHATSHAIQRITESPEQSTSSSLSPAPTGATSSSISPAPSSGVVSLLHLPAEVLSEVAEYLKHPWDKEEWYEPYLDFTCCRDEFEKRMMHDDTAKWQERRRSRAGILRFASVSKSIRKMVLMDLFKRIGFNLCANQHELAVPDLAVASCRYVAGSDTDRVIKTMTDPILTTENCLSTKTQGITESKTIILSATPTS